MIWVLKVIFCAFTIDFSRSTAIFDVRSLSYGYYDATSERIRSHKADTLSENRPDAVTILIIAMTANAFAEDIQASLVSGMNAHIAKPLVMEEVIKVISVNLN